MADTGDHDWLIARERGEDVTHVPAETRATYRELGRLIESLPGRSPSPGWKQRVMAALDQPVARPPARSRARVWVVSGAIVALAAAVILVLAWPRGREPAEAVAITEIRRGNQQHRGRDANIGDTLIVRAEAHRSIELRVYGDTGEPLARCSDQGGCDVARDGEHRRYTLELALRAPGDVRVVLFEAAAGLPTPLGLDDDLAAALRAGIVARQVAVHHVQ